MERWSPLTVVSPVASDAPLTCPVQTTTALRRAALLGRRWLLRLKAFPWGKVPPKEADEGSGIDIQQINSEAAFCQIVKISF